MRQVKIYFAIAALTLSFNSFAQKGPSFIGVSGGVSLPTGKWGKSAEISSTTGFISDPSGFAGIGPIVEVNGAYFFSKHIGLGAMVSYANYKTKDIDKLSAGYRESFDVDQVTTTAGSYKLWNFMAGPYFNFSLQKKLAFTAKVLAGVTNGTTPLITVDVEDGGVDDGTFEQKESTKSAFGFTAGVGLSYSIVKCLAIHFNADYFYSKPDFSIKNTQRENSAGRQITEYNEPLAGVNFSLGIAFLLGKK